MHLVAQVDYPEICNDIWGYTDSATGTEYAVMGTVQATVIFSLENPAAPREVAYIPGALSTWRDIKHYGQHLYVTTDSGEDGLLIIDMSQAPDSISHSFWKPTLTVGSFTRQLSTCHNLYIDQQKGFAYISGCNIGAVLILDLRADPKKPVFAGATNDRYSHDNFARGDTLYSADIYKGEFSIYDIHDPAAPVMLARQTTTYNATHNIWPSDNSQVVFTTDEEPNAYVEAYDISDPDNIQLLDRYRPKDTEGQDVIPHNTHYHQGYLLTSWYTDGVKIIDAHRPDNLIEVGHYDTHTTFPSGFHGCWGVYPFLPSGLVLASDQEAGLFVFEVNYRRAAYLEGRVTHAITGIPLNNVNIRLLNAPANGTLSEANGDYKTGLEAAGTYTVIFSKMGYFPDTVEVSLRSGEVTEWDQQLKPEATFGGRVIQKSNGSGVAGAKISIYNQPLDLFFETTCDSTGHFDMPTFVPQDYQLVAGKWGFLHAALNQAINPNDQLTIIVGKGYQDDFLFDLNWQVSGDATQGHWERDHPNGVSFNGAFSNPNTDAADDLGLSAYITGNQGNNILEDEVDYGETVLSSPIMDLRGYEEPVIDYQYWFYNRIQANGVEDTLKVWISNGRDTVLIDQLYESIPQWLNSTDRLLKEYIDLTDQMQIRFSVREIAHESLIEAGIDAFKVRDLSLTAIQEVRPFITHLSPNPFSQECILSYKARTKGPYHLAVYTPLGQLIWQQEIRPSEGQVSLGKEWKNGLYFLQLTAAQQPVHTIKLLKQN